MTGAEHRQEAFFADEAVHDDRAGDDEQQD
jgi:hypothetical protein